MGPIIKALRLAYRNEEPLRAVCDELAQRSRNTTTSSVDRLVERTGQGRAAVVDALRRLEKLDLGKFLVGRRGAASRIEWRYKLQDVGRAASGESSEIEETDGSEEEESGPMRLMRHVFQLRPEAAVYFDLPANLTQSEAARLAEFIKALPFD